jgi:hypothetical protein
VLVLPANERIAKSGMLLPNLLQVHWTAVDLQVSPCLFINCESTFVTGQ